MAAIGRGGDVRIVVRSWGGCRRLEARRADADERWSARAGRSCHSATRRGSEERLRAKLADWRGLLTRNVESGREVLAALLVGPLRFTPGDR